MFTFMRELENEAPMRAIIAFIPTGSLSGLELPRLPTPEVRGGEISRTSRSESSIGPKPGSWPFSILSARGCGAQNLNRTWEIWKPGQRRIRHFAILG